jgi:hypothetical protein
VVFLSSKGLLIELFDNEIYVSMYDRGTSRTARCIEWSKMERSDARGI